LRIDSRVTARRNATASAQSPTIWAPMTEVPSGSADSSATGRVLALVPSAVGNCCELAPPGLRVGNRPEALPPGLSADPVPFRYGRFPTCSGDVTSPDGTGGMLSLVVVPEVELEDELEGEVDPAGGVVTETVSDTWGSFARCAVTAVAVSLTDVTVVAVTGTVTCAASWRAADAEATVPRAHDAVSSSLPQPMLNSGFWLVGVTDRRTVVPGALPFLVQASTTHCAVWPRSTLVCARSRLTQRSTGAGGAGEVLGPGLEIFGGVVLGVGVGDFEGVGVAVGDGLLGGELVVVPPPGELPVVAVAVGVGVALLVEGLADTDVLVAVEAEEDDDVEDDDDAEGEADGVVAAGVVVDGVAPDGSRDADADSSSDDEEDEE
jgi:hypothetical protein